MPAQVDYVLRTANGHALPWDLSRAKNKNFCDTAAEEQEIVNAWTCAVVNSRTPGFSNSTCDFRADPGHRIRRRVGRRRPQPTHDASRADASLRLVAVRKSTLTIFPRRASRGSAVDIHTGYSSVVLAVSRPYYYGQKCSGDYKATVELELVSTCEAEEDIYQ